MSSLRGSEQAIAAFVWSVWSGRRRQIGRRRRRLGGVGEPAVGRPPLVAGRVEEQRILGAAIQGAAEGLPCAVFVHGEAGVGKTRLVRRICDDAIGRGFAVLWGQCVHFGSLDSPYLPLVSALKGWVEAAAPQELSEVVHAVD